MSNVKIIRDMPFVSLGAELGASPSIRCIATHAYRQKTADHAHRDGPLYIGSFNKPSNYIEELEREAAELAMKKYLANTSTPEYVFPIMQEPSNTVEHPLIQRGLLAPNKNDQSTGITGVRRTKSADIPRPASRNRRYIRPNTPHQYLTKTDTTGDMHTGIDPGHGAPTRTQLLRHRMQFSVVPDLTYTYLNQRKKDGTRDALHHKIKMKNADQALKTSKIEMERAASAYRKFLIGSRYNSSKWVDVHGAMKHGVVTLKERPKSSFSTQFESKEQVKRSDCASPIDNPDKIASGLRPKSPLPERTLKTIGSQKPSVTATKKCTQDYGDALEGTRKVVSKTYSTPINSTKIRGSTLERSLVINRAPETPIRKIRSRPSSAHEMKLQIDQRLTKDIEAPINSPRELTEQVEVKRSYPRVSSAPVRRNPSVRSSIRYPPRSDSAVKRKEEEQSSDQASFFVTEHSVVNRDTDDDVSEIEDQVIGVSLSDVKELPLPTQNKPEQHLEQEVEEVKPLGKEQEAIISDAEAQQDKNMAPAVDKPPEIIGGHIPIVEDQDTLYGAADIQTTENAVELKENMADTAPANPEGSLAHGETTDP